MFIFFFFRFHITSPLLLCAARSAIFIAAADVARCRRVAVSHATASPEVSRAFSLLISIFICMFAGIFRHCVDILEFYAVSFARLPPRVRAIMRVRASVILAATISSKSAADA